MLQWKTAYRVSVEIADNFCVCEGCSVPRCLLYEMYIENCSQNVKNQVNPATFGKLVRLVFPGLGTRRLGTRGSARYHYDGIYVKRSSSFYARYCSLLSEKNYHRFVRNWKIFVNFVLQALEICENDPFKRSVMEPVYRFEYLLPEFRRLYSWEQELGKNHPYELVALLADEYCSYCQDILQNVRKEELDKVEDCIISFWKSLQPETTTLMSFPDVCQLFKYYDRQLFKEMENILLDDFLEDVSIQYLKSIRLFSKNVKLWLLNALEEFPLLLRKSTFKEVTVFVKRLRRKTYLSNMAKVSSRIHETKKTEHLIHSRSPASVCFIYQMLHYTTTAKQVLLFPSKNKEEFKKLAANFQLRWNFLLTGVSKAMTLCRTVSFGSWHLFNLLLLEYVAHIFQSHLEEEGDENLCVIEQNDSTVLLVHEPEHPLDDFAEQQSQTEAPQPTPVTLMQSQSDVSLSNIFFRVLSCLVDTDTGNKLIQVMLEDRITKTSFKLDLPIGKEALITLKDGQKFIICASDTEQISTEHQSDF
uniref:DNA-binding protein RFX8 n=1 Tax=Dromaius novaehollandiae TaxID=8790 RepID=A0A8C4IYB4_DRONO